MAITSFYQKLISLLLMAPPQGRATKNRFTDSFDCFPPRKSLVKGERFVRDEGKPELLPNLLIQRYVEDDSLTQVGFAFIIYAPAH